MKKLYDKFRTQLNKNLLNSGFPAQLIFDHQGDHPLVGFVWQHIAGIDGDRWAFLFENMPNNIYARTS